MNLPSSWKHASGPFSPQTGTVLNMRTRFFPPGRNPAYTICPILHGWTRASRRKSPRGRQEERSADRYNRFMQNSYDYDALEKELLHS